MSAFVHAGNAIPVLETERLIMRGHRPADLTDSAAMWADPAVTLYIGGVPLSREAVWGKLLRYAGLWAWLGYGYWAVEEKATRALIGEVGFMDAQREMQPSLDGMPEIGWALASKSHGKGLGTEAVGAALAWFDARPESARTACIIHPDNIASLRIAQRFGYRELARTLYKDQPTIAFVRSR